MSVRKLEYFAVSPQRRRAWWPWIVVGAIAAGVLWYLTPDLVAAIIIVVLIWYVLPLFLMLTVCISLMWLVYPGRWSNWLQKRKQRKAGSAAVGPPCSVRSGGD